jgi:hypothetical protein
MKTTEQREIDAIVNEAFEPLERRVFCATLSLCLATMIIIPTLISLI